MPDRKYEGWDEVYRRGGEGPYPWDLGRPRDFLVKLVEKGMIPGPKALDTCCGLGTNGLYLAEKGFEVTGIDISGKALEVAARRAEKSGHSSSMKLHNRSFMDMGFEAESFDFVLDVGCFHHVAMEIVPGSSRMSEEVSSVEGDGATRYFHVALMERPAAREGEGTNSNSRISTLRSRRRLMHDRCGFIDWWCIHRRRAHCYGGRVEQGISMSR